MKSFINISLKLGLICGVAGLCLSFVNSFTAPKIAYIKEMRLKAALEEVSMGGTVGDFVEEIGNPAIQGSYSLELDGQNALIVKLTGKGYGGNMNILTTIAPDGEILACKLMENLETPGLGKEAEKPEYMTKYIGKGGSTPLPKRKNDLPQEEADAISGATITFSGIANAVIEGSNYARSMK